MSTSPSTLHRAGASAVLVGAAVLAVAPAAAYAGPYPVDGTTDLSGRQSRAQGEHGTETAGPSSPRVRERQAELPDAQPHAQPQPQPPTQPATRTPGSSDPSSLPVTVIALLGGSLVLGAAGFTVYRYRHHGPAGAATA